MPIFSILKTIIITINRLTLTKITTPQKTKKNVETELENTVVSNRPSYDIVEEYIKSLDEYRNRKHPSDEVVSSLILEIGDFLLEFATLGHEQNADVPNLIHPQVLIEDLKSIGVPYLEYGRDPDTDEILNVCLVYPEILYALNNKQKSEDGMTGVDGPVKASEDVPLCTAYFFYRWMWIQYPYVALGNCDARFVAGVNQKNQEFTDNTEKKQKRSSDMDHLKEASGRMKTANKFRNESSVEMSKSMSLDTFKLPELKFTRKAARSIPRIKFESKEENNDRFQEKMQVLQDEVQNYREEFDFVVQMKSTVNKRLQDLKDSLIELKRTSESCSQVDDSLLLAAKREAETSVKYEKERVLNRNYANLVTIINRYPANVPALIIDLQAKVEQDRFLIAEIKKRLWEQKFEHQTYSLTFKHMKKLVQNAVDMHMQLLEYNTKKFSQTKKQILLDEKDLLNGGSKSKKRNDLNASIKHSKTKNASKKTLESERDSMALLDTKSWEEKWAIISSKTGIIEPDAFFNRANNASALVDQINAIKKASEFRLDSLKKEVLVVESELEESRYEASFAGAGSGKSSKENKKNLAQKQHRLKEVKEKSESMEQLEQRVVAGLAHISDILFIPKNEEDTTPSALVRDIESVLDTLINEREKQQQQQGSLGIDLQNRMLAASTASAAEIHSSNRSPELDYVVAKHEDPKVRLPRRLPSRPIGSTVVTARDIEEEENEDEGMWDRGFAKTSSLSKLRSELKRAGKAVKAAEGKFSMLATA